MPTLVFEVNDADTVYAITEIAKLQGITPESAALELLETAVLAQKSFQEIVEPIARSFDESGMSEERLCDVVTETRKTIRHESTEGNRRAITLSGFSRRKESSPTCEHLLILWTDQIDIHHFHAR